MLLPVQARIAPFTALIYEHKVVESVEQLLVSRSNTFKDPTHRMLLVDWSEGLAIPEATAGGERMGRPAETDKLKVRPKVMSHDGGNSKGRPVGRKTVIVAPRGTHSRHRSNADTMKEYHVHK